MTLFDHTKPGREKHGADIWWTLVAFYVISALMFWFVTPAH